MKITVAIPTIAGRSKYLHACLRTCQTQDADFEILVSDNSGGEARSVAESFGDKRIRYVAPPRYLPMSAHWDFVLGQVQGDLLTFIGDDDGLMPNCIKRVCDFAATVGEMPIHHTLANYRWHDFIAPAQRNTVVFLDTAGKEGRIEDSSHFLRAVAKGRARYIDGPMVYHNFVPVQLLRRLMVGGVFFRRSSPDVYSALAIAAHTPTFFSTKEVLTLSGQGARANGATVQSGAGQTFLSETQSLYTPRFKGRAVQLALLDSLIEVAERYGQPDLADIDYATHFAAVILEARWIAREARHQELRWLLATARQHGVRARTVAALITNIYRRLVSALHAPSTEDSYLRGQVVKMPPETTTIFEATQLLSNLLACPESA